MALKQGLWLTLLDQAGEATPVACRVAERRPGLWTLDARVPPQWYPVTFVAAQLRLDGRHLGMLRFPEPITLDAHRQNDLHLDFPVDEAQVDGASPPA
jgi:hypothetical protein